MSTTIDEVILHDRALSLARGHVLVAGLGLGYFVTEALARPSVCEVMVVERSPDVIALVWPYIPHDRARLVEADVFEFLLRTPSADYDFVYADIWERVSPRNLPEMARIRRLAEPHLAPGAEVWFWGQELLGPAGVDEGAGS
jgi:spermidine synthase